MQRVALFDQHPDLLLAFREGKREALEQVYRAYVRSVERYLYSLWRGGGDGADAMPAAVVADVVQEVFIRAFSIPARLAYDGLRDYGPYLATIARNCFIDVLRAHRREVLVAPADLPADIGEAPEPEAWCDPRTLAVLEAYVAQLPPILKGVFLERFAAERSQEDASSALGISRRTLRTSEERLRRGLRKALVRAGISQRQPGDRQGVFSTG